MIKHINPKEIPVPELFSLMLGAIGPRPIAFASTLDADGRPNLAPFSFFNFFGANPPILIFSPSRRGRGNTTKHTYDNIKVMPEVVINVVNYKMVQQVSLASSDFPQGVNEFEKVGFTMEASEMVKPFRVKESPVQFECKVLQVIETGDQGAAGNLVICEMVKMHIDESILDKDGKIDPHKIDLVARMGGDYYCRASGDAIFTVEKPLVGVGIGVDALPEHVRFSKILTGNDLGQLGNLKAFPSQTEIEEIKLQPEVKEILEERSNDLERNLHILAQLRIEDEKVEEALRILMVKKD
ncbi:MAG: flavin reductase family protein [Bacteroidales bacterium]|nr:flavin reductase family protein [Bacteroidales bacterium]MCF8456850.1 flavin reductase family protein [Bacteroidales bacterium]